MRDAVLTVLVLGALPFCFLRPWIGVLVWVWLSMMNPHKLTWGFAQDMHFHQLVAIATIAGLLLTRDRKPIPWNAAIVILIILMLWYTATTFSAWTPVNAWEQWDKVAKIYLMTFVICWLIFGRERIRAVLLVAALSIGFYGFKGGIFSILTGGVHRIWGPDNTFIGDNTAIGLAMAMVLPLLIFLAREEKKVWLRRFLYVTAGLTCISIPLTYSRGALLGLAAVLPLIFLKTNKKFLIILLLLPIGYFGKDLVPEGLFQRAETIQTYAQDQSALQRLQAWSVAWNVAKDYPLTGAGFNFEAADDSLRWLSYAAPEYSPIDDPKFRQARAAHSIWFQVLGQHGFVAFGLFVAMLALTMLHLQRLKNATQNNLDAKWIHTYASAMQIGMIAYLVCGTFLSLAYFDLMYLYVAATALLQRELKAMGLPEERGRRALGRPALKPKQLALEKSARLTDLR
ncbi:MAG: putative O-glycosylation ligase, exosortase A system-associated [Burkholderiales bacterium]